MVIKMLDNIILMTLKDGVVKIKLHPEWASNHVNQIKKLTSEGFYNGLTFHRVIDGFMAQTGCPNGDGTGNCGYVIPAEFNEITHKRGICSMARGEHIDSASSQFFICLKDSPFLDKKYTVWGEVIEGMKYIDNIKKGDVNNNGLVNDPDKIISMILLKDTPIKIK